MVLSEKVVTPIDHLALIGNFLPRKCGLATYTTDTFTALKGRFPGLKIDVYAMDDHPGRYDYPSEVTASIPDQDRLAYIEAARAIERSGAQALWVQHEYGIYGGPAGEHILALLDRVSIPVIVTLHTVLEKPSADERRVMEGLLRRAAKIVVMAERGRDILERVYGAKPRVDRDDPAWRARSRLCRSRDAEGPVRLAGPQDAADLRPARPQQGHRDDDRRAAGDRRRAS